MHNYVTKIVVVASPIKTANVDCCMMIDYYLIVVGYISVICMFCCGCELAIREVVRTYVIILGYIYAPIKL
jgi:hypothetical protein